MKLNVSKNTIKDLYKHIKRSSEEEEGITSSRKFRALIYEVMEQSRMSDIKLQHRIRELNCFYNISELIENKDFSIHEILEKMVTIIKDAMKYPHQSSVRIVVDDHIFETENCQITDIDHNIDILVNDTVFGCLEFYFSGTCTEPWAFGTEDIIFFTVVARRLGRIIEKRISEQALKESYARLEVEVVNRTASLAKANQKLQIEIAQRKETEKQLVETLEKIKTLKGLIPICANCKSIRDDEGFWHEVEAYISKHSDASFTHGLCPECRHELYPELFPKDK